MNTSTKTPSNNALNSTNSVIYTKLNGLKPLHILKNNLNCATSSNSLTNTSILNNNNIDDKLITVTSESAEISLGVGGLLINSKPKENTKRIHSKLNISNKSNNKQYNGQRRSQTNKRRKMNHYGLRSRANCEIKQLKLQDQDQNQNQIENEDDTNPFNFLQKLTSESEMNNTPAISSNNYNISNYCPMTSTKEDNLEFSELEAENPFNFLQPANRNQYK